MKFSLIIGTLNRCNTLKYCLESLSKQSCHDYEIIIIDQSTDNETEVYISKNYGSEIYEHVEFKGLSKARNRGLELASGDYICLIDDDAYYDSSFLEIAAKYYENGDTTHILSGFIFDTESSGPFAKYKGKFNKKSLPLSMILHTCPSAALIIPTEAFQKCGKFDENLGVGSKYGAGEETDFLLRAIHNGYTVIYIEELSLTHPFPPNESVPSHEQLVAKMENYYMGIGALYKKHLKVGHEIELIPHYCKLRLKFLIKNLLKKRLDTVKVVNETAGFLNGLRDYPN